MSQRWTIRGVFKTCSPLHIGSGAVTSHPSLKRELSTGGVDDCDIQAVVRDSRCRPDGRLIGLPCIPGTAIKGVLRAWADSFYRSADHQRRINRIFGHADVTSATAESGWAEFSTAFIDESRAPDFRLLSATVPYWQADRWTGIMSHVSIDSRTGAAARNLLFFDEFVPEGVAFKVEIHASRLDSQDIDLLLAVLQHGSQHPTHAFQFGAHGANGWGRMDWHLHTVESRMPPEIKPGGTVVGPKRQIFKPSSMPQPGRAPDHVAFSLTLDFLGPLLIDDKSKAKPSETRKERDARQASVEGAPDGRTNFTCLRRATGDTWLPASSFRGVWRSQVEFLLHSMSGAPTDTGASGESTKSSVFSTIARLFGDTGQRARLRIEEFSEEDFSMLDADGNEVPHEAIEENATDTVTSHRVQGGPAWRRARSRRKQDFVAIDRFTGGAADGFKFDATYADRPRLKTRIVLDLDGLEPADVALAAAALRDLCAGSATFGFGGSKGYGRATGKVNLLGFEGIKADWDVPQSLLDGRLEKDGVEWLDFWLGGFLAPTMPTSQSQAGLIADHVKPATKGKLQVKEIKGVRRFFLIWQKDDGGWTKAARPIESADLAPTLQAKQLGEFEVDLELEKPSPAHPAVPVRIRSPGERWKFTIAENGQQRRFAHPYYFARMEPRVGKAFAGELGDRSPTGLERIKPHFYSGRIRLRLTTKTPLLICDDDTYREVNGHKTFDVRLQDDKPLFAASSLRGVLRAAYEAATNSRFGVFPGELAADATPASGHGQCLSYRALGLRGRIAFPLSPLQLLPEELNLRPARLVQELSPADRVFGWASQENGQENNRDYSPAQRSAVRVGPITCETQKAVDGFPQAQTLAILGQPKPHQGRFYLGDSAGRAQNGQVARSKERAGYRAENRLRGPKVYPHHRKFTEEEGHWSSHEASDQNRSVTGWVREGVEFTTTLNLLNLSAFELGALLWILSMPEDHFLKAGLGKPLGFGSIRVEIDWKRTEAAGMPADMLASCKETCLAAGSEWINSLATWERKLTGMTREQCLTLIEQFEQSMQMANEELLPALLRAARGFPELRIHYPTLRNQANPREHFRWFVHNEQNHPPRSLPDLSAPDIGFE